MQKTNGQQRRGNDEKKTMMFLFIVLFVPQLFNYNEQLVESNLIIFETTLLLTVELTAACLHVCVGPDPVVNCRHQPHSSRDYGQVGEASDRKWKNVQQFISYYIFIHDFADYGIFILTSKTIR